MNQFKTQFDVITQINDWFFLDLVKSFIKKFWDLFCPLLLWVSLSLKVVLLYLIIGEQGKIKTEQGTGIEFFMLQATQKGPLFWGVNWPVQPCSYNCIVDGWGPCLAPVHVMLITRREILVWKKTCNEWLAPRQTGTTEMTAICNTDYWSLTKPSHKPAFLYIFLLSANLVKCFGSQTSLWVVQVNNYMFGWNNSPPTPTFWPAIYILQNKIQNFHCKLINGTLQGIPTSHKKDLDE